LSSHIRLKEAINSLFDNLGIDDLEGHGAIIVIEVLDEVSSARCRIHLPGLPCQGYPYPWQGSYQCSFLKKFDHRRLMDSVFHLIVIGVTNI
jgi:hypothetical protein